ncbi:hypothetical protein NL676_038109 [Syzygium grande]|nr:hypothetical protein NL676_038109 [Syzygium grande]
MGVGRADLKSAKLNMLAKEMLGREIEKSSGMTNESIHPVNGFRAPAFCSVSSDLKAATTTELKAVAPRTKGDDPGLCSPFHREQRPSLARGSSRSLLALRPRADTEVSWVEVSNQFPDTLLRVRSSSSLSYSIVLARAIGWVLVISCSSRLG